MTVKAVIGVVQPDGAVLVATAVADSNLASTLGRCYATRTQATMLVSLGDLVAVGPTPSACTLGDRPDPQKVESVCRFEALHADGVDDFHLLNEHGSWTHWHDEKASGPLCDIAAD